jgi:hypothetical protein
VLKSIFYLLPFLIGLSHPLLSYEKTVSNELLKTNLHYSNTLMLELSGYEKERRKRKKEELIKELHEAWRNAVSAINSGKSAASSIEPFSKREAVRSAFEGCIGGVISTRSPIGGALTGLGASVANILGQLASSHYIVISYANEAAYWGMRFDGIIEQLELYKDV